MRGRWLAKGALFVFLSAGPLLVAIPAAGRDEAAAKSADASPDPANYVATVLDRKSGSLTLQRDGGEVVILSLDDSGISLHVDRGVVKGSRVQVIEEKSTNATSVRTLDVKLAPSPAK
jgi:hypothetical protein